MIEDASKIIESLNSPSDWAIVLGAATIGFVLDGAINIVPIPFFSPGVCGLSAASAALSLKRSAEAVTETKRLQRRRQVLLAEANRCGKAFAEHGDDQAVRDLTWKLELDGGDVEKLELVVLEARADVDSITNPHKALGKISRGGFGFIGRSSGGREP